MIIDSTQSRLERELGMDDFFADPVNLARALVMAKSMFPGWYYEIIKKELQPNPKYSFYGFD